jgi:tRNA(fMet)-specific endonuclease VapC
MYMLDTDICIYLIKGKSQKLIKKLEGFDFEEIVISTITAVELEKGVEKSQFIEKNRQALKKCLTPFKIMPFDFEAAKKSGKISADLEKKGEIIGPYDILIAAHAISLGATLITNNIKEFKRVTGLVLENWS